MSKYTTMPRGFSAVEILLVVAVIALLGFLGWRAYEAMQAQSDEASKTSQSSNPPEVKESDDLKDAEEFVSATDVESELDTVRLMPLWLNNQLSREYEKRRYCGVFRWYAREDLNLHARRHMLLRHACLPIPPLARKIGASSL